MTDIEFIESKSKIEIFEKITNQIKTLENVLECMENEEKTSLTCRGGTLETTNWEEVNSFLIDVFKKEIANAEKLRDSL